MSIAYSNYIGRIGTVDPWTVNTTTATINAAGESVAAIGRLRWNTGPGTSHTISAAGGGKIQCAIGSLTWASGSTNLRAQIQGVDATTGLEDGTPVVQGNVAGGGAGITANLSTVTMTSGSTTKAQGDLIAVVFELTARGGSDSLAFRRGTQAIGAFTTVNGAFPYGTTDAGVGVGKTIQIPYHLIVADDGAVGWLEIAAIVQLALSAQSYNSGSTPDEYGAAYSLPYAHIFDAFGLPVSSITASSTFEFVVYTDPFGTPSGTAFTVDPDETFSAGAIAPVFFHTLASGISVPANTKIGITARPTSANDINQNYMDLTSATFETIKKTLPFATIERIARTDNTGAFSVTQSYHLPGLFLNVYSATDPSGGGGLNLYAVE